MAALVISGKPASDLILRAPSRLTLMKNPSPA